MQQIRKIVITGGPCAGKTSAMEKIREDLSRLGWRVLFVPETATELISGGVAPWTLISNAEYQQCQILLQKGKEKIFERAAGRMDAEKVLIVCDRGVLDNRAYMTAEESEQVFGALGLNEDGERKQYDAVFHLTTAAKGALEAYTLANNGARYETPEEAAAVDARVLEAWTGHPHLRVIDNSTSFEEKLNRLVREITAVLEEQ
ncbi:MAG: ATP-binding protein [Eubacteriales bacterium]|nr:ATP-binding protein [Eubacteriales bacterium]